MFDDLRQTIKKVRGDFSSNEDTSIAVGRGVVQSNLDLIYIVGVGLLFLGALKFRDALLLVVYGSVPFVLDSSLILDSVPLLSRFLPRATLLIELGMEFGAISVGISLGVIIAIYKGLGALRMGLPYYLSLKERDN